MLHAIRRSSQDSHTIHVPVSSVISEVMQAKTRSSIGMDKVVQIMHDIVFPHGSATYSLCFLISAIWCKPTSLCSYMSSLQICKPLIVHVKESLQWGREVLSQYGEFWGSFLQNKLPSLHQKEVLVVIESCGVFSLYSCTNTVFMYLSMSAPKVPNWTVLRYRVLFHSCFYSAYNIVIIVNTCMHIEFIDLMT